MRAASSDTTLLVEVHPLVSNLDAPDGAAKGYPIANLKLSDPPLEIVAVNNQRMIVTRPDTDGWCCRSMRNSMCGDSTACCW